MLALKTALTAVLILACFVVSHQLPAPRRACILKDVVTGHIQTDDDEGCMTKVNIDSSFLPMERVALTCNGNLQRVMSAYYGTTVEVKVKRCEKVGYGVYDREVDLIAFGKVFCTAIGQIRTTDPRCMDAVASNKVGIGQLYVSLGVLPEFGLFAAERAYFDESLRDDEVPGHSHDNANGGYVTTAGIEGAISSTVGAIDAAKRRIFEKVSWLQGKYDKFYPAARIIESTERGSNAYTRDENAHMNDAACDGAAEGVMKRTLLWREYELFCPQMTCTFVEIFAPDFLSLHT
jgi:hypothetical protein